MLQHNNRTDFHIQPSTTTTYIQGLPEAGLTVCEVFIHSTLYWPTVAGAWAIRDLFQQYKTIFTSHYLITKQLSRFTSVGERRCSVWFKVKLMPSLFLLNNTNVLFHISLVISLWVGKYNVIFVCYFRIILIQFNKLWLDLSAKAGDLIISRK